jgi:TPR repeat protein
VDNSKGEIFIQPRIATLNPTELAALEATEVNFATTAWRTIANSADPRDFELFAELYPQSDFAPAATRQLDEINALGRPSFPLMDLGVPERNPEVPEGLGTITTACDILATGIGDVMAISEPVPHDLVNTHAALRACIAAVTNDPENPRLLGLLSRVLRLEKRYEESLYYAEQAALKGNPSAYGAIASAYRQGLGVETDYARAAEAARKGAIMGAAPMRLLLAIFYREGWGVPQSFNEARRWMKLAADAGYAPALVAYGDFFRRGQGVEKDPATAFPFYEQAAVLGSTDAMNLIGLAYMKGEGVPKDLDRGIQWLSRASDEGNPFAAFHLGRAFRDGWGVEKNISQALAFFRLSSQRNYLGAYINIGELLASGGQGLEPDLPEAYANFVIAREAALSRDTIDSKEELDKALASIATISARMSAAEIEQGERISTEWIEQYGVIDFNLVSE